MAKKAQETNQGRVKVTMELIENVSRNRFIINREDYEEYSITAEELIQLAPQFQQALDLLEGKKGGKHLRRFRDVNLPMQSVAAFADNWSHSVKG